MATSDVREILLRVKTIVANAGSLQQLTTELNQFTSSAGAASTKTDGLNNEIGELIQGLGILYAAHQFKQIAGDLVKTADEYTALLGKINLVTESGTEAAETLQEISRIANTVGVDIGDIGTAFTRISIATESAIDNNKEQLNVVSRLTETVAKSLSISGASAGEATSTLRQFTQALASGVLRGDEFNSLMENSPKLMEAVGKSLGATTGELRTLAEAGLLSTTVIANAILEQSKTIDETFAKIPITIERSLVKLNNEFTKFVGGVDQVIGASSAIGTVIRTIADNLTLVGGVIASVAIPLTIKLGTVLGGLAVEYVKSSIAASKAAAADKEAAFAAAQHALETANLNITLAKNTIEAEANSLAIRQAFVEREKQNLALAKQNVVIAENNVTLNKATVAQLESNIASEKATIALQKEVIAINEKVVNKTKEAIAEKEAAIVKAQAAEQSLLADRQKLLASKAAIEAANAQAISDAKASIVLNENTLVTLKNAAALQALAVIKAKALLADTKKLPVDLETTKQAQLQAVATIQAAEAELRKTQATIRSTEANIAKLGTVKQLSTAEIEANLVTNTSSSLAYKRAISSYKAEIAQIQFNLAVVEGAVVQSKANLETSKATVLALEKAVAQGKVGAKAALDVAKADLAAATAANQKAISDELAAKSALNKAKNDLLAANAAKNRAIQEKSAAGATLGAAAVTDRLNTSLSALFALGVGVSIGSWAYEFDTVKIAANEFIGVVDRLYANVKAAGKLQLFSEQNYKDVAEINKLIEQGNNRIREQAQEKENVTRITEKEKILLKEAAEAAALQLSIIRERAKTEIEANKTAIAQSKNKDEIARLELNTLRVKVEEERKVLEAAEKSLASKEKGVEQLKREIAALLFSDKLKKQSLEKLTLELETERAAFQQQQTKVALAEKELSIAELLNVSARRGILEKERQLAKERETLEIALSLEDAAAKYNVAIAKTTSSLADNIVAEQKLFDVSLSANNQLLAAQEKELAVAKDKLQITEELIKATQTAGVNISEEVEKELIARKKVVEELTKTTTELKAKGVALEQEAAAYEKLNPLVNASIQQEQVLASNLEKAVTLNNEIADVVAETAIIRAEAASNESLAAQLTIESINRTVAARKEESDIAKDRLIKLQEELANIQAGLTAKDMDNQLIRQKVIELQAEIQEQEKKVATTDKALAQSELEAANYAKLHPLAEVYIRDEEKKLETKLKALEVNSDFTENELELAALRAKLAGDTDAAARLELAAIEATISAISKKIAVSKEQLKLQEYELSVLIAAAPIEALRTKEVQAQVEALKARVAATREAIQELEKERISSQIAAQEKEAAANRVIDVVTEEGEAVKETTERYVDYANAAKLSAVANAEAATGAKFNTEAINQLDLVGKKHVGTLFDYINNIRAASTEGAKLEQTLIGQATAYNVLIERLQKGNLTTQELNQAAIQAKTGFGLLDQSSLENLRNQIESVKQANQDLIASIEDAIFAEQQRRLQLTGDTIGAKELEFKRQEQELLTKIEEERNKQIQAKYAEQLRLLRANNQLELEELKRAEKEKTTAIKEEEATRNAGGTGLSPNNGSFLQKLVEESNQRKKVIDDENQEIHNKQLARIAEQKKAYEGLNATIGLKLNPLTAQELLTEDVITRLVIPVLDKVKRTQQ